MPMIHSTYHPGLDWDQLRLTFSYIPRVDLDPKLDFGWEFQMSTTAYCVHRGRRPQSRRDRHQTTPNGQGMLGRLRQGPGNGNGVCAGTLRPSNVNAVYETKIPEQAHQRLSIPHGRLNPHTAALTTESLPHGNLEANASARYLARNRMRLRHPLCHHSIVYCLLAY
ncbi:uncharacterized protein LY79DRAFT_585052 [Colletotrichum navitas]|uniref:Uncharacterized protein n=1 Tax=Colletotrichum navitas TaxID=681940 RepID=A0AAD8PKB3_9PEZI|nr:uncharacterized protein LY79DRAFT_585052 [Colletotrichum navitas]KAK1566037.1 hypothetical protein LY79DRAFT_585052 [Colletotrichum navitas]